jgi:hypothetical protein
MLWWQRRNARWHRFGIDARKSSLVIDVRAKGAGNGDAWQSVGIGCREPPCRERSMERRFDMSRTTTMEEQLAAIGRRIDRLQTRARGAAAARRTRVHGHLDALRDEEASLRAMAGWADNEAAQKLEQLKTRIEVAERSLAADAADDWSAFAEAVEAELDSWDAYLERVQTSVAEKAWKARERAEAAIREVRRRRIAVEQRLAQARDAAGDGWQEQRERVSAARDELEQEADELSAKLK